MLRMAPVHPQAMISGPPKSHGHGKGEKQFNSVTPHFSTTQFPVFSHLQQVLPNMYNVFIKILLYPYFNFPL